MAVNLHWRPLPLRCRVCLPVCVSPVMCLDAAYLIVPSVLGNRHACLGCCAETQARAPPWANSCMSSCLWGGVGIPHHPTRFHAWFDCVESWHRMSCVCVCMQWGEFQRRGVLRLAPRVPRGRLELALLMPVTGEALHGDYSVFAPRLGEPSGES